MTIFNNDSNFNSTTIGLPDHIFINPETGEPDEKVLNDAIYLGNRRARKGSLKIFKDIFKKHSIKQVALRSDGHPTESVINAYCDQRFRMAMFNSAIKRSIHALKNGSSALSSEIVIPSFELVYFFKYASEIYSEKSTYDTKITSENGYSDGRVKESNITPPTNKDVLAGYQALFHIKNKLFNDLSQWSTLTEDKKKTLSCVALSIATLMNPDLLNEAFTIEPELRNYFTFMDKLSQHSSISDSLKRVEEKEAEESVEFVMAAIGDIYEQLKRSPKSKKLQRELIDSVSALHQYSSNFSEEDYSALLIEWVQSLIDIFSLYSFDDLLFAEGDQEFLVLVMMWVEYLSVQTSVAEDTDYFISHYQSVLSLVSSLASNQSNINTKIYELDSKVNEINSNLTSASLMVRRKKDKELRQIQSSINNLKDNIADIDDQVIATVLPESYTIESFDEDWGSKEVDPNEDFIDAYSNMLVAYKDWKDNQTDPQPLTTTDNSIPVVGSALDNQAEPPSLPTEEIGEAPPLSTATDESLESVEPDPVTPLDEEPSVEAEAEFEEVEEEVAVEIPSVSQDIVIDVEKELEVEIQEGHSEEGNACLYAWAHEIYIPGDLVNSAINRLIADDQIPMAAQISYAVANRKISDNVIPYELLKAAYYGMHTFNRRNVYTKSERILLKIQTNDFDQWDKLPMSGAVPYLLFMATFQPAIIGGKSNYPAILLKNIPQSCFGRNTIDLIDHIVKVSNRGEKITIDQLSIEGAITPQKTFNVQRVEDWCNVIRKSQKGYIPIKIALLNSLNNEGGLFRKITEILLNDRYEDENEVQDFISRFKEPSDSTEFLDNLLAGVDAYKTKITRTGKQTVHHKVSDLVDLAKDWLEAKPVVSTDSYTEDFCTQFAARLQIVILEFKEKSEETGASLERTAGARFVALRLGHLNRVIRGEVDVWEYSRVKAWYYHPRQIASLYVQHNDDTAPEVIQWLLARIGTEIRSVKQLELAYEKGDVRLSELLRHYLLDTNKEAPFHINIKKSFEEYLRDVRDRCNNIEGQLENVLLASEMDAETVDIYNAQIGDVQESLDRLMVLDETDDIEESLGNIETAIESTIESTKNNFLSRFDENVKQLRETIPDNAIPEEWIDDFHTTLNDNNLPVANEMIFDLIGAVKNHERIEKVKTKESPILREFIQHHSPIYKALDTAITEGRADKIFQLMKEHPENFGLEFPELSSEVKEPLLAIEHWRKGKPNTQVTETFYKQVSSVLNVLGINLLQPTYDSSMRGYVQYNAPTRGFASMYMNITESHSASPFPIFGSSYEEGKPIPVIIVYKEWKLDSVYELIKSENIIGDVQILISVVPVSLQKRNEFARFFQEMRMPVLLIDPVMLVFLASQDQDQIDNAAVRNFLWLAAPFSYFNPYSSDDSAKPTEFSEMVYGRDRQIQGLLKMVNGKAIVYGGRQLGKSTIMQQVRKRFHRPSQNQYAFYTMLDKDRHSRMEQEDSEKAHEGAQREI